ncbi:MAG: peptidase C69 [Candidatus Hodarchaeota archaeon]
MCDTFVALSNSTKDGTVIFGKNSDRPNNEIQLITYAPRIKHFSNEELKCTYISIPQVSNTNAILLSQPFWMWGAEMGANEFGVVIGNEAVYTHEPIRNIGLLGMDLLRLALERGKNADEAFHVITNLLETYHQGGGCAYNDPSWSYHNSFLIADNKKAYVLETADDWWIAEKVKDVRSISNSLSIRGKGELRKKGIIEYAINRDFCRDDSDFDFAVTFSGNMIPYKPSPFSRAGKSIILLNQNKGKITPKKMMAFLREHEAGICMHGGFESTGSQVSHLNTNLDCSVHWFTGSTLPCLSNFKPYIFPTDDFHILKPAPYSQINKEWYWVKHNNFIKASNYKLNQKYIAELKNIELNTLKDVNETIQYNCGQNKEQFQYHLKEIHKKNHEKSIKIIE